MMVHSLSFGVVLIAPIVTVGFSQSGTPVADIHAADDAIAKGLRNQ